MSRPLRIVVLASGFGSNLQVIVDSIKAGKLRATVVAVISDRHDAYALQRARSENILSIYIDARQYPDRQKFDAALMEEVARLEPELIVLAGFMRVLTAQFVNQYPNRIMNIHPSLLPKHKGLNTHERVLRQGDSHHGATVHFVTPELDAGPIILQKKFPVSRADSPASLEQRVHECEYEIYPRAIQLFADGKLLSTKQRIDIN